jgi:transcriptional regulator with PAS, ATPase and Fis domain
MDLQSIKNRFGIIGNAPALNHALSVAVQVAATDLTVIINGESGVGKEVFSQIIHALSSRKHNPFIAVNCGAIPEGTIDSELFGHEKGSFTGAVDSRKGYFETVNGGTIFLDEIAEMPLGTQARLLRMLETGEFIRVGSSKVQKTDVRVIAATNRDLNAMVEKGTFREDLYYRLNVINISLPPLSERREDIPLLVRHFLQRYPVPAGRTQRERFFQRGMACALACHDTFVALKLPTFDRDALKAAYLRATGATNDYAAVMRQYLGHLRDLDMAAAAGPIKTPTV